MLKKGLLIFFCLMSHLVCADEVSQDIQKLFSFLIHTRDFSYTLVGEKPVSIISFQYEEPSFSPNRPTLAARPLFDLVDKLESICPTKEFLWLHQKLEDQEIFALIHKKAVHDLVEANRSVFDLNEKTTLDDAQLLGIVVDSIKSESRPDRLGLLLGYGISNSRKFEEQHMRLNTLSAIRFSTCQIPESINQLPPQIYAFVQRNRSEKIASQTEFSPQLVNNIIVYQKNMVTLEELSKESPLSVVKLPVFMVDKRDSESWILYRKYQIARAKIAAIINSEKMIEKILKIYQEGC